MEIANLIINGFIFIGLWFIFYYQNSKISSLKTTIDSQKNILDSTQKFISIFDIDRIVKYVRISEDTIRLETNKKVQEAEEKIKNTRTNSKLNMDYVIREMTGLIAQWYSSVLVLLTSIRPENREIVIERISDGDVKAQLKELSEKYKNTFNPPNTTSFNFLETLLAPLGSGKAGIVTTKEKDK